MYQVPEMYTLFFRQSQAPGADPDKGWVDNDFLINYLNRIFD